MDIRYKSIGSMVQSLTYCFDHLGRKCFRNGYRLILIAQPPDWYGNPLTNNILEFVEVNI